MKLLNSMICILLVLGACQPPQDNSANEAFTANSKTIMAYLEGYQNGNLDYDAWYAEDVIIRGTSVGANDSLSLEDIKAQDASFLAAFKLELVNGPVVLLPGVNVDTKMADGSVRYYGDWKIILPGTDSTQENSVVLKMYESFDFNSEGKIIFQQSYADFSGAFKYLMDDKGEMEMAEEM